MAEIAVVIPTRNRGANAAQTASAILRDNADLELVIVDQSTDEATADALDALSDPRLRLVRSDLRGASNARNLGVASTSAPLIAFTDDDCIPEVGWVSRVLSVFREAPETALVFGRVVTPATEGEIVFAPAFEPKERVQQGVPLPDGDLGIGANFAVRRDALAELGGFDPLLGPGAPMFFGGEETDLLLRALHRGYRVVNATECEVLHLGVRTGPTARRLIVKYRISVGAALGKHGRLGGWVGVRDAWRWASFFALESVRDVLALRRPHPASVVYFAAGALLSFRYAVDRERNVFRAR